MDEPERILITGITGSVGLEIARWLSAHRPAAEVSCLIRASSRHELMQRWHRLLSETQLVSPHRHHFLMKFEPYRGDVTEPCLGLDDSVAQRLTQRVSHIIHAAAHVNFLAPPDLSRRVNVEGTRNVLDFAGRCARLNRVAHISSAYAAGKRCGRILEEELEHGAGFANTYEQSKYEAEMLARRYMAWLPVAVYRFALLPGRASDGYVHECGALHQALHFMYGGFIPMLPGSPNSLVDLMPTDHTVDVFLRLFLGDFASGRTYQICSGADAVRIGDLVDLSAKGPPAATFHRQVHRPEFVDVSTYESYVRSAAARYGPKFLRVARVLNTMVPHLVHNKVFDYSNAHAACQKLKNVPPFEDYYPRILSYCTRMEWPRWPLRVLHHAAH